MTGLRKVEDADIGPRWLKVSDRLEIEIRAAEIAKKLNVRLEKYWSEVRNILMDENWITKEWKILENEAER